MTMFASLELYLDGRCRFTGQVTDADLCSHVPCDLADPLRLLTLRFENDDRFSTISTDPYRRINGYLPEEGDLELLRGLPTAAGCKDILPVTALTTNMVAHIFDHSKNRDIHLSEHRIRLPGIRERDVLRCCDNDRSGEREGLDKGEVNISRSGRQVEYEVFKIFPLDVGYKLF